VIAGKILSVLVLIPLVMPTFFINDMGIIDSSDDGTTNTNLDVDMKIEDSYFIRNVGQLDSDEIMFYSRGGNVFFFQDRDLFQVQ